MNKKIGIVIAIGIGVTTVLLATIAYHGPFETIQINSMTPSTCLKRLLVARSGSGSGEREMSEEEWNEAFGVYV